MVQREYNELMARVRSQNSKAELLAFGFLRREKVYFQKHYKRAIGAPDIALPRKKKAIFIDGDFWHGHDFERRKPQLTHYWLSKVSGNMKRDRHVNKMLKKYKWKILRVWESDINRKRTQKESLERIKKFLGP